MGRGRSIHFAVLIAALAAGACVCLQHAAASDSIFDDDRSPAPNPPGVKPKPPAPPRRQNPPAVAPRRADPPVDPPASAGRPVPTEAEQKETRVLLRQIFQDDYAKATAPARRALAIKLLQEASKTRDDPVAVYVMLCEVADLASAGGDGATAVRALDRLAALHDVDYLKRVIPLLTASARAPARSVPPEIWRSTALEAMQVSDRAVRAYDLGSASAAAAVAVRAAPRAKDAALAASARARVQDLAAYQQAFPSLDKTLKSLQKNPSDPAALLEVGKFDCFARADWSRGLAALAHGSDEALKALATKDIALRRRLDERGPGADEAEAMEKLAEEWLSAADAAGDDGLAAPALRARAALWFARLVPRLKVLDALRVRKLLDEMRTPHLRPGLVGHYYANHSFTTASLRRTDPQVNFTWKLAPPARGMPADNFAVFWRGYIKAPRAGRYKITVAADDGSRVWIDGKLVIDEWHAFNAPVYEKEVLLTGQPQTFQLEYPEVGGDAYIRLGWKTPGSNKASLIPATALWHDPGGTHRIAQPWPENVQRFQGHSYFVFDQNIPWPAAKQFCEEMGGHLAIIETPAEQQFLTRLVTGRTPWIGLSDEREEGVFRWLDGTRPTFTSWHPGFPDKGEMGDFVLLWGHGLWADDWTGHRGFVCEWDE